MIVRGIITNTDPINSTQAFSTTSIITNAEQKFDDIKRYQQYGFSSYPVKVGENEGCEVLVYDNNQDRSIIAENDTRYRPTNTEVGSTQLYTNKVDHTITLNPIKRVIQFLSGISSFTQNDEGNIKLTNRIAELEMTVYGLKQSIEDASLTIRPNSISARVKDSIMQISPTSYEVATDNINLYSKANINVVSPNIKLDGKTTLTNAIIEGGVLDGDVTIIPTGNNTLQSEPINLELAIEQIASNASTIDISHIETAMKDTSDGTITISGTSYNTFAKSKDLDRVSDISNIVSGVTTTAASTLASSAQSTANSANSTANSAYSLSNLVDTRTVGISYNTSGTIFANVVNANVGFIANGVQGGGATARFNTNNLASFGVTAQGVIAGAVFTGTGLFGNSVGVKGVVNGTGVSNVAVEGVTTYGKAGYFHSTFGYGAHITNNTTSKPACQISNAYAGGVGLKVSGNTELTGDLTITGTTTGTFLTNSNTKVTNLNADYLDGWSSASFPKIISNSPSGSFSSANWSNIKYITMNVNGVTRKVMIYDA